MLQFLDEHASIGNQEVKEVDNGSKQVNIRHR